MDNRTLALMLEAVRRIERTTRAHWQARKAAEDEAEADAALVAARLATPLKRALETWIQDRAVRAVLRQPAEA